MPTFSSSRQLSLSPASNTYTYLRERRAVTRGYHVTLGNLGRPRGGCARGCVPSAGTLTGSVMHMSAKCMINKAVGYNFSKSTSWTPKSKAGYSRRSKMSLNRQIQNLHHNIIKYRKNIVHGWINTKMGCSRIAWWLLPQLRAHALRPRHHQHLVVCGFGWHDMNRSAKYM